MTGGTGGDGREKRDEGDEGDDEGKGVCVKDRRIVQVSRENGGGKEKGRTGEKPPSRP